MRTKTMIIVGGVVALVGGGTYGLLEYNRVPEGAHAMEVVVSTSATELHAAFMADEQAATLRFVGTTEQAIRVTGVIDAIEPAEGGKKNVTLNATADGMAGVVCEFDGNALPTSWKVGDQVRLQGICTGVNDLIPDVILVRCGAVE